MSEEVIAKVEGLRVLMLALGPEESLPWHRHSEVTETIVCSKGPIQLKSGTMSKYGYSKRVN